MKILWITNIQLPATCEKLGLPVPVVGGWMSSLAMELAKVKEIKLAIATVYEQNNFRPLDIENVKYYLLPKKKKNTKYDSSLEQYWKKITDEFQPDVIHIHGTEYAHGLACMKACPSLKYVVSIQGLVGVYSKYYYGSISKWELLKNITIRDILRFDTLFQAKRKYEKRGLLEKEYITRTNHIIGRTSWDYSHAKAINPKVEYHFCNETLREGFYKAPKWDIAKKSNFTIFLSQAGYPIKGLHQVLKAVALVKNDFDTITIRIGGVNITNTRTIIDKLKISGYGNYIKVLIKKLNLVKSVTFLGNLSEEQIITEYLNCHVFICPSSIENSPNSVGEAQILGVPTIASYVGGVPDMITHGQTGLLYQFEEIELLVQYIRQIIIEPKLVKYISINEIKTAEERHNYNSNLNQTISIYNNIKCKV
jgi:glycosyltransferase involved in cell wall biosynthesis